jgi:hypothetical protein
VSFGPRWAICSAWVIATFISVANADEPQSPPSGSAKTREQVQEALQREAYGLSEERNRLLAAAVEANPNDALPRWYLGQVQKSDGTWLDSNSLPATKERQLYQEYVNVRDAKADDAAGQKSLGDWCDRNGLKVQARVHWLKSLVHNPNQTDLRIRLDLVKVGDRWIEKSQLARRQAKEKADREVFEHWRPIFTKLAAQLAAADKEKRQAAIDEVLAVRDPAVLPALQAHFGSQSEDHELLVLQVCEQISDLMATQLLAYLAAEFPAERVREKAASLLKSREQADFVPLLISEMYTPIESKVAGVQHPTGVVDLRRSFVREGADKIDVFVHDATIRGMGAFALRHGRGGEFAQFGARLTTTSSEIAVSAQNRDIKARNERIAAALAIATGEKFSADPQLWWKWWMDLNELVFLNGKGVDAKYQRQVVHTYDPLSPHAATNEYGSYFKPPMSCLIAGTPVWTEQGLIAIERVKFGDLVLSRDVETGELAYKPVLLTTVRPKRQLTEFTVGQEKFQTTGGHLFWGSGKGWIRTKDLQPSQVLHTASSPVSVGSVRPGVEAETYNLVVADFHTYFVGEQRLLSHDNTVRQSTRMIVPGLAAE